MSGFHIAERQQHQASNRSRLSIQRIQQRRPLRESFDHEKARLEFESAARESS